MRTPARRSTGFPLTPVRNHLHMQKLAALEAEEDAAYRIPLRQVHGCHADSAAPRPLWGRPTDPPPSWGVVCCLQGAIRCERKQYAWYEMRTEVSARRSPISLRSAKDPMAPYIIKGGRG